MAVETHLWLQTVHLLGPSALATQCLLGCISISPELHLNVFGTAPRCLWDCISMSLELQVSAERLAALNPRLYNFQLGNFDYTDEELHLGQLQGTSFTKSLYILCL